jgi:hypothetical protein
MKALAVFANAVLPCTARDVNEGLRALDADNLTNHRLTRHYVNSVPERRNIITIELTVKDRSGTPWILRSP